MKKIKLILLTIFLCLACGIPVQAVVFDLDDWNYYVDGVIYEDWAGDSMPTTGSLGPMGTLTWSTNIAGAHTFIAMFDFEIDQNINTFFNETGIVHGSRMAGQSYEIDEPGFGGIFGDIYYNVIGGNLDNTNALSGIYDDVSFAIGWDFTLAAGETAFIDLILSDVNPGSGFYLEQFDPNSDASIFFSSTLDIEGDVPPIPEPATLLLLGTGLVGLLASQRKKLFKK